MPCDRPRWRPPSAVLVLRLPTAEAVWLAGLALEAGVTAFEVTLTERDYRETFAELRHRFACRAAIGVGSIRTADGVRDAAQFGAEFAVTPVHVAEAPEAARDAEIPFIQGAATPSEINGAWEAGSDVVKVFPAGCLGGPGYIKSILAPMPELVLMASGGVDPSTAGAYLGAGAACVALGSSVAPPGALEARDADAVRSALARLPLP